MDAGPNGVNGIIGWYVPEWMADKYPDITDWNNLNKYADLFKTSESGDKGQFLGGDPTFVQNDEALIANLGLNYKVVFSGSEAASITAFQQADQEQDAADRLLLRPAVAPERDQARPGQPAGVHGGLRRRPEEGRLRLPAYKLNKIVRTEFAEHGGDAATFIKNFKWTNADQNAVADAITNKSMKRRGRRQAVGRRQSGHVWQAWMPVILGHQP